MLGDWLIFRPFVLKSEHVLLVEHSLNRPEIVLVAATLEALGTSRDVKSFSAILHPSQNPFF